ncbi:hypothetical protein [Streptomyces viridosporus]|uniref:hypothetical protein n=1 Tax=Streptomyces viridosporus TaxID=67581 RepID=UPI0036FB7EB0
MYVLYNAVSRQLLPLELGFGSGQTSWRRLGRWREAGVFDRLHRLLLAELHAVDELDWSRVWVDASRIRAKRGRVPSNDARQKARRCRSLGRAVALRRSGKRDVPSGVMSGSSRLSGRR